MVGGFSCYEGMEVRDIIAYLKLAMNQHDSIALQRVINTPARGIGKMTLDEIDVRSRELGVSYWDAITDLLADERRLAPRAAAALANFQRIVKGLAAKAQSALQSSDLQAEEGETRVIDPSTPALSVPLGWDEEISEDSEDSSIE